MSDYYEGLEEGIKVGRDEAAAEIARLRAACDAYFKTISLSQIRHGRILVGLERRNARHRRALAKLYQRRHDKNAEITRLRARVAELEEALAAAARLLHKAGEQFTFYAKQHATKGTADDAAKAATNQQWAERCFSAYWAANDTAEGGKDE